MATSEVAKRVKAIRSRINRFDGSVEREQHRLLDEALRDSIENPRYSSAELELAGQAVMEGF